MFRKTFSRKKSAKKQQFVEKFLPPQIQTITYGLLISDISAIVASQNGDTTSVEFTGDLIKVYIPNSYFDRFLHEINENNVTFDGVNVRILVDSSNCPIHLDMWLANM